jgi:hypothetical protein
MLVCRTNSSTAVMEGWKSCVARRTFCSCSPISRVQDWIRARAASRRACSGGWTKPTCSTTTDSRPCSSARRSRLPIVLWVGYLRRLLQVDPSTLLANGSNALHTSTVRGIYLLVIRRTASFLRLPFMILSLGFFSKCTVRCVTCDRRLLDIPPLRRGGARSLGAARQLPILGNWFWSPKRISYGTGDEG